MKKMTSKEIREMWFKFFESKGHKIIPSASLVPIDDDSLLWINSGVASLKKYFDGTVVPDNKRITNIQKCIRTNDIENVGVTKRHHTFFEMMGNFSIGDYFKEEAIAYSFELLTDKKWFNIPLEKLYFTVYTDDLDAYNKWINLGVPASHIAKLDDNFWEIGEGPSGPDSEIFFDRGPKYDKNGDALEKFFKGDDNERFVEIWNNVFSQFNAKEGVKRSAYKELPSKNIDTGAGLERWACIFQDADSNFDTDLFLPIIKQIEEMSGTLYDGSMPYKVLADHIRALTFALADGAIFDNVGRGYILRRLLRRSVRYGRKLGLNGIFMYKLVDAVVLNMKDIYPYLLKKQAHVKALIIGEEELFLRTLDKGEKKLYELIDESLDNKISGNDAFRLYDTYGFPFELTLEYLEEKGFTTNKEEFLKCMEEQKKLSKNNQKQSEAMHSQNKLLLDYQEASEFIYESYELKSKVLNLIKNNEFVSTIEKEGYIVFNKTCFYAESGGQVSDTGMLIGKSFKARVLDVFKAPNGQNIHKVKILSGKIKIGDSVDLIVDRDRRISIEANHSSVHILQLALQSIIDKDIHQAGSKVDYDYSRFDFNYHGKITDDDLIKIEDFVNNYIKNNYVRETKEMNYADIEKENIMALFTEKYSEKVRVVQIGESRELCGGCHVKKTSDIDTYAIISFENKGSNTYRITSSTGKYIEDNLLTAVKPYNDEIVKLIMKAKDILAMAKKDKISLKLNIAVDNNKPMYYRDLVDAKIRLAYIMSEVHELEKKYKKLKNEKAISNIDTYEDKIKDVANHKVLLMQVNNMDTSALKNIMDSIANKYSNVFIMFANIKEDTVSFLARSNSNISAVDMIKIATTKSSGNGGGSKTFAQGGGKTTEYIDWIFKKIESGIK